jgi:hypothetical protein
MKNKPSWAMTFALWTALTALFFTSEIWLIGAVALALLWPHFVTWRYPRDSSTAWLVRLLCYGGIFAFYGGRPGVGADWIFDAKTFNTIGLIAAAEAVLQAWREPPENLRFQPLLVLQAGIIFLAACNTYDERYIRILAPFFIGSTLLALRDVRLRQPAPVSWQAGRIGALLLAVGGGAALHYGLFSNRDRLQSLGVRLMMQRRIFEVAGISNQPSLGSSFNARGSTQRVLLIHGALNDGHLRAAAFDSYSGGRWSPPLDGRAKVAFPELPGTRNAHVAHITKLAELSKLVFAPLNAVAIAPPEGSSFDWHETLGPLLCEEPVPYSYDVFWSDEGGELGVPLHQGPLCAPPSPAEMKALLEVAPEVDPRVHALARRLTAGATDDADKIEAVAEYLLTHNKYSLRAQRGRGDPVSSFILERKAAHCEYFASAAAILLRCAGVPARYATGFYAHETVGDETTVRQRDAHAWAEAWINGVGWITVDATPADGTPAAQPEVSWWQRTREKWQDAFARWRERWGGISRPQLFGFIAAVALLGLAERWRQARRKKRLATKEQEYSTSAELAQLAARFETILRKRKVTLPAGRTWSEHLTTEQDAPPEYSGFITAYNRARFGGAGEGSTHEALQHKLEELEKI